MFITIGVDHTVGNNNIRYICVPVLLDSKLSRRLQIVISGK